LRRCRTTGEPIRDEALKLFDEGHIRAAAKYNDLGFNSFFRRGWKRFYLKWYDAPCPRRSRCAQYRGARPVDPDDQRRDVRHAAGGRRPRPSPRSVRGLPALSPRPRHAEQRRLPHLRRRATLRLARREAVLFDETFIHWAENKTDVDRLILFCDVERPLRSPIFARLNHWVEATFVRATQTENAPGDKVGLLNRIFSVAYFVRLPGKRLKAWNKYVYYAVKFVVLAALIYVVFFSR
jgi:beta-hydroxylase